MRKWIFAAVLAIASMLVCLPAMAQTRVLDSIYASVEIPDTYITITPETVTSVADWLEARGTTAEATLSDMEARGVLVQSWSSEGDMCFELSAVQNDTTLNLFDINSQTESIRAQYRLGHFPENIYQNEGYTFSTSNWKNTDSGRFLILRYANSVNGQLDHRGLMRRTIRNGYEITFDMRIYSRSITNKDNTALNKIWDTFQFIEVLPLPPAASAKINITEAPPAETNSDTFNLAGTAAEGVKFTAVVMGLNYPDPMLSEVQVGASGKFKLPIKLPKDGVFMITVTAEKEGEVVMELAYPVTYQRTLLTINLTTTIPEQITTDEFDILGTATPGAEIQIFVNDEEMVRKKVTAAGKFKITLDTSTEGPYDVVLAFSKTKSDLTDRRINFSFTRSWSENDMAKRLQAEAIKPSYANLVGKVEAYDGRIMGYKCYLTSVSQSGDSWIMKMALNKQGSSYSNYMLVTTNEQPDIAIDTRVMMYGTFVGMSIASEEVSDTESQSTVDGSYPCFELLLLSQL